MNIKGLKMSDVKEHNEHEMNNDDTVNQANNDISIEDEEYVDESNPVDNDGFPDEDGDNQEQADYSMNETVAEHHEAVMNQEGVQSEEKPETQAKNALPKDTEPQVEPAQSSGTQANVAPAPVEGSNDSTTPNVVADAKAKNKSNTMSNQEFIEKLIELEKLSKAETDREKEFKQLLQEMREEQQKRSKTIQKVNEEAQEVITFMQNECGFPLELSDPLLYELLFIKKTFAATLNDYRETLSNATAKLDEKIVRILAFTEAVDKQQANFINSITAEYVQQKKAVEQSMDNAKESIGEIIEEAVLKANKEAQNAENQAVEEFTSTVNQKITDEFKFFKYLLYGTLALSIIGIFL